MSARDEAVEMIRRICPAHLDADWYGQFLAKKFDAHRTEVLREAAETVAEVRETTDVNVAEYRRYDFRQRVALSDAETKLRRLADEAVR